MIPPPTGTGAVIAADWVELSSFKSALKRVSRTDVLDELTEYFVTDPEAVANDAWHEMTRRERILGGSYPFVLTSAAVEVKPPNGLVSIYQFMLLLAQDRLLKNLKVRDYASTGRIFETIVTPAVAAYVNGTAVRVGHPRDAPIPKSFRKLLKYLGASMSEGTLRARPLNPDTKDCKADIVAWRSFADSRGGKIVVFVQCAASARKRMSKLAELSIEMWARYIEFTVPPVRGFAVPFIETDEERWLEYGTIGGIAFDRLRIQEMLALASVPQALLDAVTGWCDDKMLTIVWDSA